MKCFWVLRLRLDWPIKTKRVGFWQVPQGSYLRMPKGKALGSRRDARTVGKVISEIYSEDGLQGMFLHEEVVISLRPL